MSLLAYNKTTSPLTLAAGTPSAPVLSLVASSAGARSKAHNVTAELQGLSGANYTALQAQVASGLVEYEWSTGVPEFSVGSLVVGAAAAEELDLISRFFVNGASGNDANPGTEAQPLATIEAAENKAIGFKQLCEVVLDADGVGRTYTMPTLASNPSGTPAAPYGGVPRGTGVRTAPYVINSLAYENLVAEQSDGTGGYNFALNGTFPTTTVAVDPGPAGTTISLASAAALPSVGMVLIESELVRYTGKSGNDLIGCTRGYCNTTAAAHAIGVTVLLRLDGYWARVTEAAVSSTLSAGISATDTTIPLTSAASFQTPSGATPGFILMPGGEIIAYTAKSGNNLTGCLRGYQNTTAAAYSLGATVQGGPNLLAVRQIKYNTASLCVIMTTFPGTVVVGSKYVIERTATKLDLKGWGCPDSDVAFRNVKLFTDVGGVPFAGTRVRFARCEAEHVGNGNFAFISDRAGAFTGGAVASLFGAFGSATPIGLFEDASGLRCERPSGTGAIAVTQNAVGLLGSALFVNCAMSFAQGGHGILGTAINTLGGSLTLQFDGTLNNNFAGPIAVAVGRQLFNRTAIINESGSNLRLRRCDIVFPPTGNSLIISREGSIGRLAEVGGVGASRYGLEVLDGSMKVDADGVSSTLTADPGAAGTTISLTSAAAFGTPAAGSFLTVQIENEIIFYTGKAGNDLTGCIRGMQGTVAAAHAIATVAEQGTCLKGTLGGLKVGSRPVRTWADYHSAAPASGLPVRNEFDVPGFVARPFKLSFAGLVAADAFDITTLAAFATPAGATATVASIWETAPPAVSNGSTVRVTAGAAAFVGNYVLTDAAGTLLSPATDTVVGTARISDDGKTITFPVGTLATAFILEYTPVSGLATGARVAA